MPTNNHYGTVLEANQYFDNRLFTFDWDRASPQDKIKALNMATSLIDQFDYIGQKYPVQTVLDEIEAERSQTLGFGFPNKGTSEYTDEQRERLRVANLSQEREFPRGDVNDVPTEIEHACYLIAKELLGGREPDKDLENLGTRSAQYGDVKTTYDRNGNVQEHIAHLIPSPEAFNKIRPFLRERNVFEVKRT